MKQGVSKIRIINTNKLESCTVLLELGNKVNEICFFILTSWQNLFLKIDFGEVGRDREKA